MKKSRLGISYMAACLLALPAASLAQKLAGWSYTKELKMNTTSSGVAIGANLEKYPVPVVLSGANFDFEQAKADGSDIRFTKPDGTLLPHEIEMWDKAGKAAGIWVSSTVQTNSASQAIWMHWGNPGAPNTSDSKAVFAPADGWVGVWHLGDNADSVKDGFKDATGVNHMTGHNMEKGNAKPGRVGLACDLNHLKNQGLKVVENRKNFDLAKNVTFEILVFWRSFGYNKGYESFMTKGDESWRYMRANKTNSTEICSDGNAPVCVFGKTNLTPSKWYHFAGVHDGRAVRLYINGVREAAGNASGEHYSGGDHPATLGFSLHRMVQQRFMDQMMDEARITKDSKTDDWIKLDWESVKEGSTFMSHGTVSTKFIPRSLPGWIAPKEGAITAYDLQGRVLNTGLKAKAAGVYVARGLNIVPLEE